MAGAGDADCFPFPVFESTETEKKRERGNGSAAAKILQRDLGLAPSSGHRRGTKSSSTEADANAEQLPREGSTASESSKKENPSAKASKRSDPTPNVAKTQGNDPSQSADAVSAEAGAAAGSASQTPPAQPKQ
ncbi:hypothetical protein MPDQ_005263 [Monascus purpureus]|uniref:Uncharacterized protein n=1 Tax=Monascus purpureus TaxID=5098 RepID=A0A507QGA2_MONPU|nr:hypothetical protein MPDQ_005263 [Monascus purpureus]